jgi:hypothetical protein
MLLKWVIKAGHDTLQNLINPSFITSLQYTRFQVLTAFNTNTTDFRIVAPCSIIEVDVSEVLTASIIRAMSKTST